MEVERPTYTLWLVSPGDDRLGVMRAIRALCPAVSPTAAKALADGALQAIKHEVNHFDIDAIRRQFRDAGATVEFVDNVYGRRL